MKEKSLEEQINKILEKFEDEFGICQNPIGYNCNSTDESIDIIFKIV